MPTATVHFDKCIQDSQDYGSDDEHMVSRVFLTLEAAGKTYPNLTVDIKQTVGAKFESSPLEVSPPKGYKGSYNYAAFRELVEQYYRGFVGSKGRGIRIEGGADIRMRNNTFVQPRTATFEYTDGSAAW
jgi:hypothetical protein